MDDRLTLLFEAHHQRLFRLARRMSGSRDEAFDLLQETFLRAARHRRQLPDEASAERAWLVRTMVNLCRDGRRRAKVRAPYSDPLPDSPSDGSAEHRQVSRLAVQAALGRLSARRRAIIALHELEGESVMAIAALFGLMPVTVRWHLMQGRRQLARILS